MPLRILSLFFAALILLVPSPARAQVTYTNSIRQFVVFAGNTPDGVSSSVTGVVNGNLDSGEGPGSANTMGFTSNISPTGVTFSSDIVVWTNPPEGGLPAALAAFGANFTVTTPISATITASDNLASFASVSFSLTGGAVNVSGRTLNQTVTLPPGTYGLGYSLSYLPGVLPAAGPASFSVTFGPAGPSPSAITFQGSLKSSGLPASGLFDLEATLFDAPTGGTIVGGPASASNVAVTGGLVTADLDFGPFATAISDARYMEVRVRQSGGGGAYTTLAPRTRLAPSPRALFADQAAVATTAGTATTAQTANSAVTADNATFANFAGTASGIDLFTRGLIRGESGASNNSPGLIFASPLSAPIERAFIGMASDTNIGMFGYAGAGWGLTMRTDSGSVGIGTLTPTTRLDVVGEVKATGFRYAADRIRSTTVAFTAVAAESGQPVNMFPLTGGAGGPDGTNTALIAQVDLPPGAIILDATAFYIDNDIFGNLAMDVLVYNPEVPNFTAVGTNLPLSSASSSPKTAVFNFPTGAPVSADRPVLVRVHPVSSLWGPANNKTIQAVKIRYTVTAPD
ncbi:MAG: hypothetical protein ACK462_06740 [Planctomyces sp.]